MDKFPGAQTLLFDADDTLWENNVFFERAIDKFIALLEHGTLSPEQVRRSLYAQERECVARHGYGADSFVRALLAVYQALSGRPPGPAARRAIAGLGRSVAEHPFQLIAGVPATLAYLSGRHRLMLLTKGNPREQARKVAASGLRKWFSAVEIVPEKDAAVYRALARRHDLRGVDSWMVGNSPRSDINPALAAGLNAVFIPHPHTWALEREELARPARARRRLLRLERFSDLREHF
ncbi:MAG: HAD family hydrolase [Elusimicrobia bacterium]|nr:HAD family hydrolase [Elusimicrobiota bacterium]